MIAIKVNVLKQNGTWTDDVTIKGKSVDDAVKRVRAYLKSINAEQPSAICPRECGDHILGTQTETCANCFAAIAFRRY